MIKLKRIYLNYLIRADVNISVRKEGDKNLGVSLFEPIHGSYPEAAGKDIANPMAMILSSALMLDLSFNMKKESEIIIKSVEEALNNGFVTQDINQKSYYSTKEVGNWISEKVRAHF